MKVLSLFVVVIFALHSRGQEKPLTPEDQQQLVTQQQENTARREAAIAEFTRKMKEANYPALFDQAATEFNVPADVLKAVAFAETRWDHLTWPPGETASPDSGMPRPYGIMSLWDNQYFGHSLIEGAKLIGRDPEELKADPLQNIRGAAALLRKLYDSTPRPDGSSGAEIESWRYAIRVYCGIPEPDLNARHALDIYTFMSRGYHQFGVEWNGRPVNLDVIREETGRIVAEEKAKREAIRSAGIGTNGSASNLSLPITTAPQAAKPVDEKGAEQARLAEPSSTATPARRQWTKAWLLALAVTAAIAAIFALYRIRSTLHK